MITEHHDGDPAADSLRRASLVVFGLRVAEWILEHRPDLPIIASCPGDRVTLRTAAALVGPGRCYTELAVDGTGVCVAAHWRGVVCSPAAWHLPYPQAALGRAAFVERLECAVGEAALLVAVGQVA